MAKRINNPVEEMLHHRLAVIDVNQIKMFLIQLLSIFVVSSWREISNSHHFFRAKIETLCNIFSISLCARHTCQFGQQLIHELEKIVLKNERNAKEDLWIESLRKLFHMKCIWSGCLIMPPEHPIFKLIFVIYCEDSTVCEFSWCWFCDGGRHQ